MAKLQVDAHFSEPAYPQCRAIQQEVQNSWCMYRELKQRRFWAMHVNRKWGLFLYNMTWRLQICIAKCLYSHKDDFDLR